MRKVKNRFSFSEVLNCRPVNFWLQNSFYKQKRFNKEEERLTTFHGILVDLFLWKIVSSNKKQHIQQYKNNWNVNSECHVE